jgi:hypothetical protein
VLSLAPMRGIIDATDATDTFILVRTVCCEGYKQHGRRCEICPNRPENRQATLRQTSASARMHEFEISYLCAEDSATP